LQKKDHGKIRGLILDLRDNPGGWVDQAFKVADAFLDGGLIVYAQGRNAAQEQHFAHHKSGFHPYPMVVLVNSRTASASEILAAALRDRRRALIVGTRTFGKGSFQRVIRLDDHSALSLTTALYFTPSGCSIQAVGIEPDVVVDNPKPALASPGITGGQIQEAPEIHPGDPPGDPKPPKDGPDVQLEKATYILKHWDDFSLSPCVPAR
jgi:carboxyl-terminal processing protease